MCVSDCDCDVVTERGASRATDSSESVGRKEEISHGPSQLALLCGSIRPGLRWVVAVLSGCDTRLMNGRASVLIKLWMPIFFRARGMWASDGASSSDPLRGVGLCLVMPHVDPFSQNLIILLSSALD